MKLRAEQLSGQHMGSRITLTHDGADVTGILSAIAHEADLIADRALCEAEPTLSAGRTTLRIKVGYMPMVVERGQVVTVHA